MSFDWIRGKQPTADGIFVWCLPDQPHHACLGSNCIPVWQPDYGCWSFWTWAGVRNTSADAIWVGEEGDEPEDSWEWEKNDEHIIRVWDMHGGLPKTGTSKDDAFRFVNEWLSDHENRGMNGMDNWIGFRNYYSAKWFQRYSEQNGLFCILRGHGRIKEKDEDGNLISLIGGGVFCSLLCWEDLQKLAGEHGAYSVGRKFYFSTDSGAMSFLNMLEEWGIHWDYSSADKVVTIK